MRALAEIYTIHYFAPLESNLKTMKSTSRKRHPGEKQSTGEEKSRPQQRREACGKLMKNVHRALYSDIASKNCADSKNEILPPTKTCILL